MRRSVLRASRRDSWAARRRALRPWRFGDTMSFTPLKATYTRTDGRDAAALRALRITPHFMPYAEGSALIEMGATRIICTATLEESVPRFRRNSGQGWLTAEYAMLPRATTQRTQRETGRGGPSGRTHEIQRLIGRSLRAVTNLSKLGERTVTIDCDVLQADGGHHGRLRCAGACLPPPRQGE